MGASNVMISLPPVVLGRAVNSHNATSSAVVKSLPNNIYYYPNFLFIHS